MFAESDWFHLLFGNATDCSNFPCFNFSIVIVSILEKEASWRTSSQFETWKQGNVENKTVLHVYDSLTPHSALVKRKCHPGCSGRVGSVGETTLTTHSEKNRIQVVMAS